MMETDELFYAPAIEATLTLPEAESQHCVRVLRHSEGDTIGVADGRGTHFLCRLVEAHPKHARVQILGREQVPVFWPDRLTLAVGPTKHLDRLEWLVEKLTEVGIDAIVPLLCRQGERRVLKTDRLEKTAVAALKQSLKGTLPAVGPLTPLPKFLQECRSAPQRFIATCDKGLERLPLARAYHPGGGEAVVAIGPEGDFSPQELRMALEAGFTPVSLGPARLRTETAALAAIQTLHALAQQAALEK